MTGGAEQELAGLEHALETDSENTFELEFEDESEWNPEQTSETEALFRAPRSRLWAGAQILRAAGIPTRLAPSNTQCPTPAQVARDRCIHPGTKTCPAIPDLLCLRDVAGLPFEYVVSVGIDPSTHLRIVSRRTVPVVQKFIPAVRDALNSFVSNMSRFAMPIEAILTLGSLYCRCVSKSDTLSNHSFGDAIDVAGVRWSQAGGPPSRLRETIVHNWDNRIDAGQRSFLRRINACLRLSFNTVIDYHRTDHRDHFHCDTNKNAGSVRAMGTSTTTPHFTQESLTEVLGRTIPVTGKWDNATMRGLQDFSGVPLARLKDRQQLNQVLDQLFTRVAAGSAGPGTGPMGMDQFPFDSSRLTPYHQRLVDRVARRVAASWSTAAPVRTIRIVGHTDSRGPAPYNHGLGLRRANSVQAALASAIERVRPGIAQGIKFLTHSLGATQPAVPSQTQAGAARNRRVTVALSLPSPSPGRLSEFLESEASAEAPGRAISAPPLLYSEATVATETHYVSIPLGKESPATPMTGIFIPQDYRTPSQVDLLIYLHGHHKGGAFPTNLSIDVYWLAAHYKFWPLREGVNISNKNVILVAPTLGPASEGEKLDRNGGFDDYVGQVLGALTKYGPFKGQNQLPPVGNIILACHSGGGARMRSIAGKSQINGKLIKECWGFDCLYNKGDEDFWAAWAKSRPDAKVYIHYGNGGTETRSELLRRKRVANVFVEGSTSLAHNMVPITHWQKRLAAARFLIDR
jgi:outer membrane protein OmpA-like peptidoglycan-associated protein